MTRGSLGPVLVAIALCAPRIAPCDDMGAVVQAEAGSSDVEAPRGAEAVEPSGRPERDPLSEAAALELAGFRSMAHVLLTSDPDRSRVLVDDRMACYTPCRQPLPPGLYRFTFVHEGYDEVERETRITAHEQVQIHAVHGRPTPWKFIVPLGFVGGILAAGGISAVAVDRPEMPADESRFQRNVGIASIALGVPFLALAAYLLAAGSPGESVVSMAPAEPAVGETSPADGAIAR